MLGPRVSLHDRLEAHCGAAVGVHGQWVATSVVVDVRVQLAPRVLQLSVSRAAERVCADDCERTAQARTSSHAAGASTSTATTVE